MIATNKKVAAEVIGTFALVFIGAGAVIVESHTGISHSDKTDGAVGLIGIAAAHGLTLAAMIFAFGPISGAHFNPAVTLAAWMQRRIPGNMVSIYAAAQVSGAILAATFLALIFPDEVQLAGLGTPSLAPKLTGIRGVAIELIITYLLTVSVLFVTREDNDDRGVAAGITIGGTLAALILFAGPLTGAAANPVRFLGPALVAGRMGEALVYLVGPLVGGCLAALSFDFVAGALPDHAAEEPVYDSPRRHDDDAALLTIRRAHGLFRLGYGEEAAALVLPLLAGGVEYSREVMDRVRTLLIVIEEEVGPLQLLDRYRGMLRGGPLGNAAH
jgi:MIP family channel proteins